MERREFFKELQHRAKGIPQKEVDRYIEYCSEYINDLMDEGKTEPEAIQSLDDLDLIVEWITEQKEKPVPKHIYPFRPALMLIILICVNLGIWSLFLCAAALSLLIAVIAAGGIIYTIILFSQNVIAAVFFLGFTFICIGFTPFSHRISKGLFIFSKSVSKNLPKKLRVFFS